MIPLYSGERTLGTHWLGDKLYIYTVAMDTKTLSIPWGGFLQPLSVEVGVLFFEPSFHCCFYIVISFGLTDVASSVSSTEATSGRPHV
jgi:hypothetical protein